MALALTLAVLPRLHDTHVVATGPLLVALAMEFGIGSAVGFAAALVYDGAYAGGRLIDDYVGIRAIAPSIDLVAPSGYGRIWSLAFTGAFFLLGVYRVVILAFAQSFDRLPVGAVPSAQGLWAYALLLPATIVETALAVAAPALALAFVVQIALGAISRTVPRFGGFSLSFPLVYAAALIATVVAVPALLLLATHPLLALPAGAVR